MIPGGRKLNALQKSNQYNPSECHAGLEWHERE